MTKRYIPINFGWFILTKIYRREKKNQNHLLFFKFVSIYFTWKIALQIVCNKLRDLISKFRAWFSIHNSWQQSWRLWRQNLMFGSSCNHINEHVFSFLVVLDSIQVFLFKYAYSSRILDSEFVINYVAPL